MKFFKRQNKNFKKKGDKSTSLPVKAMDAPCIEVNILTMYLTAKICSTYVTFM